MNILEARNYLDYLSAQRAEAMQRRDAAAYRAIEADLLAAQRNLQELVGGEFAIPLAEAGWMPSHPNPLIFSDGFLVWVICPIASSHRPLRCRVVKFAHVLAHRASMISDTLEEQPLFGRGLEPCKALEVMNSSWLTQLGATIEGDAYWTDIRHFALCFKDSLIEIVAKTIEWLPAQLNVEVCITEITNKSPMIRSVNGELK
jgi:hypothetical protein